MMVLLGVSCGSTDDAAAPVPPANAAGDATVPLPVDPPPTSSFTTYLGLECSFEAESATYTFGETATGFPTIEGAVEDWLTNGDGVVAEADFGDLEAVIDGARRVHLVDRDGAVRVVVLVTERGGGWLVESTERCVDP